MATKPMQTEQANKTHWVTVRISPDTFLRVNQLVGPRGRGQFLRRGIELALAEVERTSAS